MRLPRSVQLFSLQGFVHQFWRCHNREFYLEPAAIKSLYLSCIKRAQATHNKSGLLKMFAYTVMDNHFHNLMAFADGSSCLSNFLRQAHSLFGSAYNKLHKRFGKVAEGRPKTSLIENVEHLMRVHFYIEANPVRAGRCTLKQLHFYKFSSYRFYAYGIKDEFSELLTPPDWYQALGPTARLRQARYRSLFRDYLDQAESGIKLLATFIGSTQWVETSRQMASQMVKMARLHLSEPHALGSG